MWLDLQYLAQGAAVTVLMSVIVLLASGIFGTLLGIIATIVPWPVRLILDTYLFALRGVPILVVMLIGYYSAPAFGYRGYAIVPVTIAMGIYLTALVMEIIRGAIQTVPKAQYDAARGLGMRRRKVFEQVVLPQAVRFALPGLVNTALLGIKYTAYASLAGVWELSYAAREIVERSFAPAGVFLIVMLIYFSTCYPLSVISRRLEQQYAYFK